MLLFLSAIVACACTGQVHPTLSLLQPDYGAYCGQWISGAASFCYVNSTCPGAVLDTATGWYTQQCTCSDLSAGGATCSSSPGYSYDLVVEGDMGSSSFEHWYEFSTARDPTYIIDQSPGGPVYCAGACNNLFDCVGFQLETAEDGTITCTLLSNLGHRVRTTAMTQSFKAVVASVTPEFIGQGQRYANAYNTSHQVFILTQVTDPNACVTQCAENLYCSAVFIAQCPGTNVGLCIGLDESGGVVPSSDDSVFNIAVTVCTLAMPRDVHFLTLDCLP